MLTMNRITIVLLGCLLSSILANASFASENQSQYDQPNIWLSKWLNEEKDTKRDAAITDTKNHVSNIPSSLVTLATTGKNGQPTIRVVQTANNTIEDGIIFYTHSSTVKAHNIKENPKVALNYWLPNTKRQVSIEGKAKKLPSSYAKAAWVKMPKWMQINLTVSDHTSKLESREKMDAAIAKLMKKYKDKELPMVDSFIAYVIQPKKYIFYSIHSGSFADKFVATKIANNKWTIERRQP
jgi:pyridoxamine 5'-phosphate oxidase